MHISADDHYYWICRYMKKDMTERGLFLNIKRMSEVLNHCHIQCNHNNRRNK